MRVLLFFLKKNSHDIFVAKKKKINKITLCNTNKASYTMYKILHVERERERERRKSPLNFGFYYTEKIDRVLEYSPETDEGKSDETFDST